MTIVEKAKELGQMIIESREFIELQSAEIRQRSNKEATEMIENYNIARKRLMEEMRDESITPDKMSEIKAKLQGEFDILSSNSVIKSYIEANSKFQQLMNQVNSILSYYVNGEQEDGCGGNCGGCSGCH